MKKIAFTELKDFGARFLVKRGVPAEIAAYVSDIVTTAEAFRQSTHGLVQFKALNDGFGKALDPAAVPVVVSDRGAAALIEGERCIGLWSFKVALDLAGRKARTLGVGFAAVRNGAWVGALGIPLIAPAREGFLCQAFAQTSACKDCAPVGGIDARFSTNPMAVAFPAKPDPVIADFSTAAMSMAAASGLAAKGAETGTERFLDKEGRPTRKASVIKDGGTLLFSGGDTEGHKFYALSLFMEALTAMAGGSANHPDRPSRQNCMVMVLNPEHFGGRDYYQEEMARFLPHVKSAKPRPGRDGVRLPGERGFAALRKSTKEGIPLEDSKVALLRALALENGVPSPV